MMEEEKKGEMGRGRKTRNEGEKGCIAIGLCQPEGGVLYFFFFSKTSGPRRP